MKKLAIGLMVVVAFVFVSYNSFAHCGKCGHDDSKCKMQSSVSGCKTMDGKCAKTACCKTTDGKPCCDKCAKAGCSTNGAACPEGCTCKCCAEKKACNKAAVPADPTTQDFAPDPVCGMDIETKDARFTYEYEGKTYYFCCENCKERFSKDPSEFLGK